MKKPTFMILGFPKCGTTLVRDICYQHPNIFHTTPEEPGFFDASFRFTNTDHLQYKNLEDYLKLYSHVKDTEYQLGEGSVYQIYSRNYIQNILNLNPEMKFIICLRNPVNASISMHSENRKKGGKGKEPIKSFFKAFSLHEKRVGDRDIDEVPILKYNYKYLFDYTNRLKSVNDLLLNRSHYILFENLVENFDTETKRLFEFLGVTSDVVIKFRHVNKAKVSKEGVFWKLIWLFIDLIKYSSILSKLRGRGFTNNYFFMKKTYNKPLSDEKKELIDKELKQDYKFLESLTALNIKEKWGR